MARPGERRRFDRRRRCAEASVLPSPNLLPSRAGSFPPPSDSRMPDGLARRSGSGDADGVGGVKTIDVVGLDEPHLEALRAWVAGGAVPRV